MRAWKEGWTHPNPKKQLVIQQFLLSDSITSPSVLCLSFSRPLIKFPCPPHFQSKNMDGQQKAHFFAGAFLFAFSHA